MADLEIKQAIILTLREEVKEALRQEIKAAGFASEDIINTKSAKEFLNVYKPQTQVLIIVDWEAGPEHVFDVLRATRGAMRTETTPILLIAAQVEPNILQVGREFHISKVHVGPISRSDVKLKIKEMMQDSKNLSPIRQLMVKVEGLIQNGAMEEAKGVLLQLREKTPDNERVALDLASVSIELEDWALAEQTLENFVKNSKPTPRVQHLWARIQMKKGNKDAAINAFKDAQALSPWNVDRLLELGAILLDEGRSEEAKETFESALDIAPETREAKMGKGHSMIQLGEVNEALAFLKESASTRELAAVFNTAAIFNIKKQEHEKAFDLYRSALKAIGNKPKVKARLFYNMGIGFVKASKATQGLECFIKATELDPGYEEAKFNARAIQAKLGGGQTRALPPLAPLNSDTGTGPKLIDLNGMEERLDSTAPTLDLDLNTDFDEAFQSDAEDLD